MSNGLAVLLVIEALLFALTMGLAGTRKYPVLGEYVGTAFHLLLLPVVAALPALPAGQASGFLWVGCDVVAGTGMIWSSRSQTGPAEATYTPIRMAGHLFAAVWVALVSLHLGAFGVFVGFALAFSFAIYTLAAGRIPEKALAVPGLLIFAWLLLLSFHVHHLAA